MGQLRFISRAKVEISGEECFFKKGWGGSHPSGSSLSGGHGV